MTQKLHSLVTIVCLIASGLITGCANTLLVEGDFPTPLMKPMPLKTGLVFLPEFEKYQYVESDKNRSKWIIHLGDVQQDMFETVAKGMFSSVVEIDTLPPWESPTNLDLIIAPRVSAFQYTLPSETKIKVYEVWIKYNLQMYQGDGTLLADWILTAYGKTPDGFIQTNEGALNEAIIIALRDAGANLIINFTHVPEIRTWLEQRYPSIVDTPKE